MKILQAGLSALLAVIVFFCNHFVSYKEVTLPDGAERIQYGQRAQEQLDLFVPEGASGDINVCIMVHGGAWVIGTQRDFQNYCKTAAEEYGFAAATVDYTKIQNGCFIQDEVEEIYEAVKAIRENLIEKGLNPKKMCIAGHSAGANLSLLYAYRYYDKSPIEIAFVAAASPPASFFDDTGDGNTILEKFSFIAPSLLSGKVITRKGTSEDMLEALKKINPIDNVTSLVPPTLLIHGAKDTMVPYSNSLRLCEALTDAGVYNQLITYPNSDHMLIEDKETMNEVRVAAFMDFASRYF